MPKIYKAYNFRSKDPAIDTFRTVVEDHFGRRVNYKDLRKIEESGGPCVGAMAGWFFGKTLRPQNPTLEAAGRAIGMKRVWVSNRSNK
jgi:hypothetical protein